MVVAEILAIPLLVEILVIVGVIFVLALLTSFIPNLSLLLAIVGAGIATYLFKDVGEIKLGKNTFTIGSIFGFLAIGAIGLLVASSYFGVNASVVTGSVVSAVTTGDPQAIATANSWNAIAVVALSIFIGIIFVGKKIGFKKK